MPPNQSRSAGAFRIALISCAGSISPAAMPSAAAASGVTAIDLAARLWTPPPAEIGPAQSAQDERGSANRRARSA